MGKNYFHCLTQVKVMVGDDKVKLYFVVFYELSLMIVTEGRKEGKGEKGK